jgi:hypothetical protein
MFDAWGSLHDVAGLQPNARQRQSRRRARHPNRALPLRAPDHIAGRAFLRTEIDDLLAFNDTDSGIAPMRKSREFQDTTGMSSAPDCGSKGALECAGTSMCSGATLCSRDKLRRNMHTLKRSSTAIVNEELKSARLPNSCSL